MHFLSLSLMLLLQTAKLPPPPGMPATTGVYYRQSETQWIKIEPAVTADTRSKGMGMFLDTNGLINPDMTVVFKGARAPAQFAPARPVFFVRGVGSSRDAMIILVTRKKDSRTLQSSSNAAGVDNKGGFKKRDIQSVTVTIYADNSYAVIPDADLKPGEYLLLLGFAHAGFDFGIVPAKR